MPAAKPFLETEHPVPVLRRGFARRALRLAGPYWNSERKWQVRGATALLLALTIAQVALTVWTNYWHRELFDALEERSIAGVLVQVGVFALIFALTLAVTAAHLMAKRWLQLDWRRWLTKRVIGHWMESGRHYRLLFTAGEHDNPDGRIAEDIRIVTETAIALAHTLVFSLLVLGTFIDILWKVSGSVHLPGTALHVPGYLVGSPLSTPASAPCSAGASAARWCARPTRCRPPRRISASGWRARASIPKPSR